MGQGIRMGGTIAIVPKKVIFDSEKYYFNYPVYGELSNGALQLTSNVRLNTSNSKLVNKINLTNVNTIKVLCYGQLNFSPFMGIGTTTSINTRTVSVGIGQIVDPTITDAREFSLDVSDLAGEYYLGFSSGSHLEVFKWWLE